AVAFSADGSELFSGSADENVIAWDVASGKQVRAFAGKHGQATAIACSPSGKVVAIANQDRKIRLLDQVGKELHVCSGHEGAVAALAFAPDEKSLASGGADKT